MEFCMMSEARLVAIVIFESISNYLTILNPREFIVPQKSKLLMPNYENQLINYWVMAISISAVRMADTL